MVLRGQFLIIWVLGDLRSFKQIMFNSMILLKAVDFDIYRTDNFSVVEGEKDTEVKSSRFPPPVLPYIFFSNVIIAHSY